MIKPITIFISYAHEDVKYLEQLLVCLVPFVRERIINVWTDKNILAGDKWDATIKASLQSSEMTLFLVSPDFMASDYIHNVEIKNAIEKNKLRIIPIIIRPVNMSLSILKDFQSLPTDAKAVSDWPSNDSAWVDVTEKLEVIFEKTNKAYSGHGKEISQGEPKKSTTFNRVNSTNKILMGLVYLLIAIGIFVLIYGFSKKDYFFVNSAFASIGIGLVAYFLEQRIVGYKA